MESMKSGSANHSHHPNKVAINSLETDSNKQTITSNVSGSTLNNNNKSSGNNQQQQQQQQQHQQHHHQSTTESKENNFEYDDNEWDVGGIGDLIKDLDNDIKKTSETVSQTVNSATSEQSSSTSSSSTSSGRSSSSSSSSNSRSSSSSPSSLSTPSSSSTTVTTQLNQRPQSIGTTSIQANRLIENEPAKCKKDSAADIAADKSGKSKIVSPTVSTSIDKSQVKTQSGSPVGAVVKPGAQHPLNKQKHLALNLSDLDTSVSKKVAQKQSSSLSASASSSALSPSTSKIATVGSTVATDLIRLDKNPLNIGNMSSSNTAGQTTGKASNKVATSTGATNAAVAGATTTSTTDHQATQDKGPLKMKIKRTKPGTKTSEAKHEIVKAEQNGSLSGTDDINTSSLNTSTSGSGNKKLSLQQQQSQQQLQPQSQSQCQSQTQQQQQQQPQNQQASGLQQSQSNLSQSQTSSPSQLSSSPALTSTPNTSQTNKRANSSHRRDKTRDKTSYSQRDKGSNSSAQATVNNSGSLNNSDIHNNSAAAPANSDRNFNCHDLNASLSTPSKAEHELLGTSIDNGLSQRISSTTLQSSANSSPNSNIISTALNSTSTNTFGSLNSNSSGSISSSKTPNAPGPPQIDAKLSYSTTIISHMQHQSHPLNFQSNNILATLNSQSKPSSSSKILNAPASPLIDSKVGILSNGEESSSPPPTKKIKCEPKDMVDVCVGTSVGTITEPDCLGPCEPGTSVTLEGIVWHETEGGVLVVNVTWRGKTYVGTLLDCTKHDWAPPRFCDSPTEELDSRTPKGRAKRGRSAAQQPSNDLSNFTETRSSVHSKLRNASAKGRAARTSTSATTSTTNTTTTITASNPSINSTNSNSTLSASPPDSFLPAVVAANARRVEKRKSKDDSPPPSFNGSDSNGSNSGSATNSDLNVQIPSKKVKTATPCAISPVLLECPEQDCSKKYKHANGLKYHQSHAHGAGSMDEDSQQLPESPRDAQQLPDSPPPIQKHAPNIRQGSPLPSSRSSLSSFESIAASGFGEITPTTTQQSVQQPDQSNDTGNSATEQSNTGSSGTTPTASAQRSRTPTPSLETKSSTSVPAPTIQESNQKSPNVTAESNALPLIGQSQSPAANNNSVQTPKNENQTKAASTPGPQAVSMVKTQKKQRKEGTNDFDNTSRDRDDVQSPAYSDISDDSTPVTESEISGMFKDKNQVVKHPADILPKKVGETLPPQSSQMGYGIYHFCEFPQAPAATVPTSEHANGKSAAPAPPPTSLPGSIQDYKAPTTTSVTTPVSAPDLTTRSIHQHSGAPPPIMSQAKLFGNHGYYPYNYMPPGYPYNMENYGPVSMVSDDGKLPAPHPIIKEERLKESPSPNENPKSQLQNIPVKMVKTEPGLGKDLKQPPQQQLPTHHEGHPKDMNTSPIGPYSSMFQRQSLNVPQPQHAMREEELRRYYMYPDQRRPGAPPGGNLPSNITQTIKDEPQSPSQQSSQSHRGDREKDRSGSNDHSSQPKNLKSSGHNAPSQQKAPPKDAKSDEKEAAAAAAAAASKAKQQDIGQKPTFESQGPPPPPTSQFYAIHSPYISPGPFGFEPTMYRNMMVPYPNSSPYHLPMSRFHAPEDLSRNTNTKALDILQHQAAQYAYNPHKIHELSERALKSPTGINSNSQSQHQASQPPVSQQSSQQPPNSMNPNLAGPMPGHGNMQTPPTSMPSTTGSKSSGPPSASQPTNLSGVAGDLPPNKDGSNSERSPPPPMRHIHTHHHTHVGVGLYPSMYPGAYSAAVLTPPQAAVAVINPFPPGPTK